MQLTLDRLEAFAHLVDQPPDRIRSLFTDGGRDPSHVFVAERDGALVGTVSLLPLGGSSWVLGRPVGDAASLVGEAVARARELGAEDVGHRPLVGVSEAWQQALRDAGFAYLGDRVEYDAPVEALPSDDGTPLTWRTMADVGFDAAARAYAAVAEGDPHGDGDHAAMLADYLADPFLSSDPACVQLGYQGDDLAAFVVAQVARQGWARITYVGVVPGARGRGLGRWAHRRGFVMLREQGGKLYHGGTSAENAAMIRLFESHGCRLRERMQQWELTQG